MPQMRRPDPRSLCVVAAGIVLAAGSAAPQPPAARAAGPPAGGAELTAAEIGEAQQTVAGALLAALGSSGWTGPDGSAPVPGELPKPHAVACSLQGTAVTPGSGPGAGARRHLLSLQLTGPLPESPERARDQAQSVLTALGAEMLSALTPGPDAPPEAEFTFTAAHDGGVVTYAASGQLQKLKITSRCSADPALAAGTSTPAT